MYCTATSCTNANGNPYASVTEIDGGVLIDQFPDIKVGAITTGNALQWISFTTPFLTKPYCGCQLGGVMSSFTGCIAADGGSQIQVGTTLVPEPGTYICISTQ